MPSVNNAKNHIQSTDQYEHHHPQQKNTQYKKSFYPQTIDDWNDLNLNIRNSPSISSFKKCLSKLAGSKPNPLFLLNSSTASIIHTRIRLGLSGLSSQRCDYNHINDPKCVSCGGFREDPLHYFLLCPSYDVPRTTLLEGVCALMGNNHIEIDFTKRCFRDFFIDTLLSGTSMLTLNENVAIVNIVQTFIKDTHRFP